MCKCSFTMIFRPKFSFYETKLKGQKKFLDSTNLWYVEMINIHMATYVSKTIEMLACKGWACSLTGSSQDCPQANPSLWHLLYLFQWHQRLAVSFTASVSPRALDRSLSLPDCHQQLQKVGLHDLLNISMAHCYGHVHCVEPRVGLHGGISSTL